MTRSRTGLVGHTRAGCSSTSFVRERCLDGGEFWLGAIDPLSEVLESVDPGRWVWNVGGVDVGFVSRAGEGYVGALAGGVARDDQVGGVGRVPLGWECVLHVGEAEVGLGDLAFLEAQFGAVREAELERAGSRVDACELITSPAKPSIRSATAPVIPSVGRASEIAAIS